MNNAIQTIVLLCCACSLLASKAVSVPERNGDPVSAATPAAVQVANDDAIDVDEEATTAEAQEAIEPEAVSSTQETAGAAQSDGPVTLSAHGSRAIPGVTRRDTWDTSTALSEKEATSNSVSHYTAPPPAFQQQGRYVLTSQPVYGGPFGSRVVGYRQVWVWRGASYRYQRPVYYRYSNCANGRCN